MNERIKELAHEAGISQRRNSKLSVEMEKFAELLIMKCADISFKHWENYKGCSAHFSIREHFGIEYNGVEE